MARIVINEQDYYRTVYGGWLGKNIGGTLGAPVEGEMELLQLTFYPRLADGPLENDDLDLQLVSLHALEQYGARLTAAELGQEWKEHVFFPFDEYGYALANLRRGLVAPVAGRFNNPFADCMGAPIRSEIWAMIAPAAPDIAAYYAYQDAIIDHAGGEGVYGEIFFAVIESAVFVEKDRDRLIQIGLRYIPESSRTAQALQDLLRWHAEGADWIEARRLILAHYGSPNFTDAPQNIAFTVLGWLYGESFEDSILKAVNCGYDTDCTAATLGAILGMILGPEGLPEKWVKPVGDSIVVSPPIRGFSWPTDLGDLTRRTIRAGKEVLAAWGAEVSISAETPSRVSELTVEPEKVRSLLRQRSTANRYLLPKGTRAEGLGLALTIDYGEEGPAIASGGVKLLTLTLENHSRDTWDGKIRWQVPKGWNVPDSRTYALAPGQTFLWTEQLSAPETIAGSIPLGLTVSRYHDSAFWSEETVAFFLVAASRWRVFGPGDMETVIADFAGDRIDFAGALPEQPPGVYTAESRIVNPRERKLRLIAATAGPVRVWLNGQLRIDEARETAFIPAFHRAPESKVLELTLQAGVHDIRIEIVKDDRPLELYVLPVSLADTTQPGPYFYLTELRFDANARNVNA